MQVETLSKQLVQQKQRGDSLEAEMESIKVHACVCADGLCGLCMRTTVTVGGNSTVPFAVVCGQYYFEVLSCFIERELVDQQVCVLVHMHIGCEHAGPGPTTAAIPLWLRELYQTTSPSEYMLRLHKGDNTK